MVFEFILAGCTCTSTLSPNRVYQECLSDRHLFFSFSNFRSSSLTLTLPLPLPLPLPSAYMHLEVPGRALLDNLLPREEVGVLLVRADGQGVLLPQVRSQVAVRAPQGVEHGLDEVTGGTRVSAGTRVAIGDSGKVEDLLANGGGHKSSSAGGRNQPDANGSALSCHLGRDGVGLVGHTSPVASADWNDIELGNGDGSTDGVGHLGSALHAKADVPGRVSDSHEGLEAGPLSGRRLLLHWHDPHDLIGEGEEMIDDLSLLHGDGMEEDLLDRGDASVLDKAPKLGDGGPDLLLTVSSSTATPASSTSTVSTAASESSSFSSFSHFFVYVKFLGVS